jgi:hypothetical protein
MNGAGEGGMRYRIGEEPDMLGTAMDQSAFNSIALFSLLLGLGFVIAGLRSRHYWLTIWGTGLSLWSAGYLVLVTFFL